MAIEEIGMFLTWIVGGSLMATILVLWKIGFDLKRKKMNWLTKPFDESV